MLNTTLTQTIYRETNPKLIFFFPSLSFPFSLSCIHFVFFLFQIQKREKETFNTITMLPQKWRRIEERLREFTVTREQRAIEQEVDSLYAMRNRELHARCRNFFRSLALMTCVKLMPYITTFYYNEEPEFIICSDCNKTHPGLQEKTTYHYLVPGRNLYLRACEYCQVVILEGRRPTECKDCRDTWSRERIGFDNPGPAHSVQKEE